MASFVIYDLFYPFWPLGYDYCFPILIVIIILKFPTGFKSGELTGQSRTFVWFFKTLSLLFWQHDMGPDLAKKYPTIWKCCLHVKHSEEDILSFFQLQWCGISLPGNRNNERRQVYRRNPAQGYERRANSLSRW